MKQRIGDLSVLTLRVEDAARAPRCRNCGKPLTAQAVREGADACSVACVREFVIRGRGRQEAR